LAHAINIPTGLPIPVPVMSAPDLIEPGVIGILRPVLLLPEGIEDKLNQRQLDAILAHEFCHVERRDNLTAAIHMAVQSIFWFHPLTWWIGTRLVAERERACDEEVLRRGYSASVYAESILAICRLYLSTPLACVSGVTGSNLKRRIEAIMKHRSVMGLNLPKKIVLIGACVAALLLPVAIGVLNAPPALAQDTSDWQTKAGGKMAFDVASVKLSDGPFVPPSMPLDAGDRYSPSGGYFQADFPLWTYIQFAYKLWAPTDDQQEEIARAPKWITTDRYRIEARVAGIPTKDQFRLMVQALLADRFRLTTHFATREGPALALTLVKAGQLGPKLIPHANGRACGDAAAPIGPVPAGLIGGKDDVGPGNFPPMCDSLAVIRKSGGALMIAGYRNATIDMLAGSLAGITGRGRPLIDRTGLSGRFDFTIEWAPESNSSPQSDAPAVAPDPLGPAPSEALRDQLGLKLESVRAPVKILVIDRVEKPSGN
jgi:uncharacterized protein (TIGR03435 family)